MGKPFRLSEADPALRAFAHEAWTDADKLAVLADRLLTEGKIALSDPADAARLAFDRGHDTRDDGLYDLEAATREWICDLYTDLELRVTGLWPDIVYTVWRNPLKAERGKFSETLCEKVEIVEGVRCQPRLLRAATTPEHE